MMLSGFSLFNATSIENRDLQYKAEIISNLNYLKLNQQARMKCFLFHPRFHFHSKFKSSF